MISVVRIETETGSHIEPPLDQNADPLTKLLWHAAVLKADTGALVYVNKASRGKGFCLSGPGWSMSDMTFRDAWVFINGIEVGARKVVR